MIRCFLNDLSPKSQNFVIPSGINIVLFRAILNIIKNTVLAQKVYLLCNNFNFFDFRMLKYIELKAPGAFSKHQLFVYLHLWPLDGFFQYLQKQPYFGHFEKITKNKMAVKSSGKLNFVIFKILNHLSQDSVVYTP